MDTSAIGGDPKMQLDGGMSMTAPPPALPPAQKAKGGSSSKKTKATAAKSKLQGGSRGGSRATSSGSPAPGADGVIDEKRIKFLERNRAAATRCREKKKQWLQQLQQRANTLNTSNKQMYTEMNRLREEVSALKNLITQQQGPDALKRAGIALSQFSDPNFDLKKYATTAAAEKKTAAKGRAKK